MGCMNKLIKRLSRHFEIFNETRRIRRCYESHIARIRNRRAGTKIKVLFIVSEIAKWKEQSLYEAMARSEDFDPMVAISAYNGQSEGQVPNDRLEDVLLAANGIRCRNTLKSPHYPAEPNPPLSGTAELPKSFVRSTPTLKPVFLPEQENLIVF